MGVQRLLLRNGTARIRPGASYISRQPDWSCELDDVVDIPPRPPLPAAPRSLPTSHTHTMAMRLAVGRPLGAAARASSCSRAAVRSFASTALRAKEVAGSSSDTPNMRVRRENYRRGALVLTFCAVCPSRPHGHPQSCYRQPGRQIQRQGRGAAQIRPVPHVMSAQIHPTVRHASWWLPAGSNRTLGSPSGRMS